MAVSVSASRARFILNPAKEDAPLKPRGVVALSKGDIVRYETPGGGGYGDVADRDEAALAVGLKGGKITGAFIAAEFGQRKLDQVLERLNRPAQAAE